MTGVGPGSLGWYCRMGSARSSRGGVCHHQHHHHHHHHHHQRVVGFEDWSLERRIPISSQFFCLDGRYCPTLSPSHCRSLTTPAPLFGESSCMPLGSC